MRFDPARLQRDVGRRIAETASGAAVDAGRTRRPLGVSARYIQSVEGGRQNVTLSSLARVARELGAPVRALFDVPTLLGMYCGRRAARPRRCRGAPGRQRVLIGRQKMAVSSPWCGRRFGTLSSPLFAPSSPSCRPMYEGPLPGRDPGPLQREIGYLVPRARFELARLTAPPPQDGVSTSSTTWARAGSALRSTAPGILQDYFLDGAGGFAGGVWVFCAGIAAPPVAGAGAV